LLVMSAAVSVTSLVALVFVLLVIVSSILF
jgi:hypothetical protein